jgi:hypothetical protein
MKNEPKKDYQIAPVRMSPDVKRQIRIIAAENGTSMAEMIGRFALEGLEIYKQTQKSPDNSKRKTA